jgi:hypothetical protein
MNYNYIFNVGYYANPTQLYYHQIANGWGIINDRRLALLFKCTFGYRKLYEDDSYFSNGVVVGFGNG